MTVAAYKYVSDDGTTYQVVLPSDFAAQFAYVPASGNEAYLPAYIIPRFASYQTSNPALYIPCVLTRPFHADFPLQQIVLGGRLYHLVNATGERRAELPAANIFTVAGPQGDKGDKGNTGAPGADGTNGTNGTDGTNADIITINNFLNSGSVLSLHSSPSLVIGSNGSNTVIDVVRWAMKMLFITAPYTFSGSWGFYLGTTLVQSISNVLLTTSADAWIWQGQNISLPGFNPENLDLYLSASADPTGGGGTLKYNIDYRVIDFS